MNQESQTPPVQSSEQNVPFWTKYCTTITPFSKTLALVLFIALPFVGFQLGLQYAPCTFDTVETKSVQHDDVLQSVQTEPLQKKSSIQIDESGWSISYPERNELTSDFLVLNYDLSQTIGDSLVTGRIAVFDAEPWFKSEPYGVSDELLKVLHKVYEEQSASSANRLVSPFRTPDYIESLDGETRGIGYYRVGGGQDYGDALIYSIDLYNATNDYYISAYLNDLSGLDVEAQEAGWQEGDDPLFQSGVRSVLNKRQAEIDSALNELVVDTYENPESTYHFAQAVKNLIHIVRSIRFE